MSIQSTERYPFDDEQAFRTAFQGQQAGIWTAEPGIIQGPIAADGTVTVQLAIQAMVEQEDGSAPKATTITQLIHCPVQFPGGNGFYLTHPLANGDECLVVFARRCIDTWWQNGGIGQPVEQRLHDISDGFCIPGVFSKPRVLPNISATSVQLRTSSIIMMDVTASQVTFNVPVVVNAEVTATGDVVANSGSSFVSLKEHIHNDVQSGTGNSGPPVGGT